MISRDINVNDLKKGRADAFEQAFSLWYSPLCQYAYSILHNSEEAEDIVQRMFYKLWDKHKEIEIKSSIKSYLYRSIHNDCLNEIKHKKVKAEYVEYKNYSSVAYTEVYYNELENELCTAMEGLPPQCRKVFEMSRYEQLSYAEIAKELNLSVNTVENHIAKALKVLRIQLKDYLPLIFTFLYLTKSH